MTQIISDIVNGFKEFLAKLEQMPKDVVDEISAKAPAIAQKILVLLREVFNKIKERISQLIKMFKAKLDALATKRTDVSPGPIVSSFGSKLRKGIQAIEKDAGREISELKKSATSMVDEAKSNLRRLSDGMEKASGDVTEHIEKVGKEIFIKLLTIGENTIKEVERFASSTFKEIEVDGTFVFKHSLQAAEAATISSVNPLAIGGIALSVFILVLSHSYAKAQ